jgi:thiamine kinase-like enzyme
VTPPWLAGLDLGDFGTPVRGEQLRHWALSEVWRVWNAAGTGLIVKRCTGTTTAEAGVYEHLLPPGVPAPRLVAVRREPDAVVFALTDAGVHTLEQHPIRDGYLAAARTLARIRCAATDPAATDESDEVRALDRTREHLARLRPDLAHALDATVGVLPRHRELLARRVPRTLVHGDFHAKNLIHDGTGGIVAVDWSDAARGRHLGDLYCLLREARRDRPDLDVSAVPAAYLAELARLDPDAGDGPPLGWQLDLGGLLWTLTTVHWIVTEAVTRAPFALDWLDELVGEAAQLTTALRAARPVSGPGPRAG